MEGCEIAMWWYQSDLQSDSSPSKQGPRSYSSRSPPVG